MEYDPEYECDMHTHTTRSDGNDTPKELIDKAINLNMRAIAITDHDTPPPNFIVDEGQKINIKEYAQKQGLNFILGYEFSTDTYVDDVHILGFELDWSHKLVKEEVERAKKSKSKAYRELCEILSKKGMPIDYDEEILKHEDEAGNIKKRPPDKVERKFIFEKMAEKDYAETWEDAKLLVRDNPELNVRRPKIDPIDAIELIHECEGMAFLAHPYLIDEVFNPKNGEKMTREKYIDKLIENNLDGIEACYTYHKTSYKGEKTSSEIESEIKERYKKRLCISGGSDYHAGYKKGVENPRLLGEAGIEFDEFKKIFAGKTEIV